MKKFVAIVIALVMVLSMTSAFAFNWTLDCGVNGFDWACPTDETNCGKATVEVVPYVRTNSACNDWKFVESDCATAINEENIYFALKLTVPADINAAWYKKAALDIDITGTTADVKDLAPVLPVLKDYADNNEDGWVFYYANGAWKEVEEADFDVQNMVITKKVNEYAKAKVCFTIKSSHTGLGTFTWGDYVVDVTKTGIYFEDANDDRNWVEVSFPAGKVNEITYGGNIAFYNDVVADFNLNACALGTCINADTIKANFGWDDKQQDCFAWSDKGATTVNPECAVTVDIPKTGDVSVVAYAVMAIVAAAGTMLKK